LPVLSTTRLKKTKKVRRLIRKNKNKVFILLKKFQWK